MASPISPFFPFIRRSTIARGFRTGGFYVADPIEGEKLDDGGTRGGRRWGWLPMREENKDKNRRRWNTGLFSIVNRSTMRDCEFEKRNGRATCALNCT